MLIVVSSYIHVSQSLHMLHLVLLLAYSEHNPAKHLKPPKLVEFISLKQIMHRNIFIPTLFIEKLVVDFVINDHQHTPKLRSLLSGSGVASMSNVLQVSSVQSNTFPFNELRRLAECTLTFILFLWGFWLSHLVIDG